MQQQLDNRLDAYGIAWRPVLRQIGYDGRIEHRTDLHRHVEDEALPLPKHDAVDRAAGVDRVYIEWWVDIVEYRCKLSFLIQNVKWLLSGVIKRLLNKRIHEVSC